MNPYKPPESDLVGANGDRPKSILAVYYLMALSFFIFLIEEFLYAVHSEAGIYDLYNYIFIPVWIMILSWVGGDIRKRKENPKYTFLFLAFLVSGVSILDPLGPHAMYSGFGEAVCFLAIFYLLNRKESKEWFE